MADTDPPDATRDAEFATIALPLLPAIARVAQALTRDASDADDLVQDTYLKAYRHWRTFEPGSDCKRWLSAICRNTFFAQRTRQKWVIAAGDDLELETFAALSLHKAARDSGVEDMFARLDIGPAIQRAVDALEPNFRDVVQLVDVQDFKYEEAAETLGIPVGTVRSRLYRARRQLQQELLRFAVDAGFGASCRPERSEGPALSTPPAPHREKTDAKS